ncbi:MAG: hypothetical protein K2X00_09895 [Nitrospiraceae bacterium]|nr:hypothetical protein [Nitrospiraceae bacterium]
MPEVKKVVWINAKPLEHGEYIADWSDLQEPVDRWPEVICLEEFRKWHDFNGIEFMYWKDEYNGNGALAAKWYRTDLMPDEKGKVGKKSKHWTLRVLNDC